jgi:AcrR family transcriptional regulator
VYRKNFTSYEVLGKQYHLPYDEEPEHPTEERILMKATLLFALKGYYGTTTKTISEAAGVTEGAFYRHFPSKQALWEAVINHAVRLYQLYHERLGEELGKVKTFTEGLNLIFTEPLSMHNIFTIYAFALVSNSQLWNEQAGEAFRNDFMATSINFHKAWLDDFIARGLAQPFDTELIASLFACVVVTGLNLRGQELLGREMPFALAERFEHLRTLILQLAGA